MGKQFSSGSDPILKKVDPEPTYCGGIDPNSCSASKCDCINCCMADPDFCFGMQMTESCKSGEEFDDSKMGTKPASKDKFKEECCKKSAAEVVAPDDCGNTDIITKAATGGTFCDTTTETVPAAKLATAVKADGSDYKDKCCATKVKCESFTCSMAGTKAVAATTECSTIPCEAQDCCEADTTKCLGVVETCGANRIKDEAKYGAAATSSDYDDKCCTALATCKDFHASDLSIGTTSASTQQHAATLSLLLVVLAAMGKHLPNGLD
jgi:hypothetical protein